MAVFTGEYDTYVLGVRFSKLVVALSSSSYVPINGSVTMQIFTASPWFNDSSITYTCEVEQKSFPATTLNNNSLECVINVYNSVNTTANVLRRSWLQVKGVSNTTGEIAPHGEHPVGHQRLLLGEPVGEDCSANSFFGWSWSMAWRCAGRR